LIYVEKGIYKTYSARREEKTANFLY